MADFKLRVGFAKQGAAVWLSHLEVVRAMERTIRRSGIPYAVSQGFSPHIKHSFSAALPVGTGSLCEYLEVELEQLVAPEEALRALQAAQHPSLPILTTGYAAKDASSLQVDLNLATYRIVFEDCEGGAAQLFVERLKATRSVEVAKKGKLKTYELTSYVQDYSLVSADVLELSLISRPEGSLRPEVLLSALGASSEQPLFDYKLCSITRTNLQHKEL